MKILVVQTAFPGDAILTLPLLQEIKKNYTSAVLDVLCIPSTTIIFSSSPIVDNIIEFDKKGKDKNFFALFRLIKKLRREKYKIIFSPHRSVRSSIITFFSKPEYSCSFDKSALSFLYKKTVKYRNNWHEVRRNLSLLDDSYINENWKILPQIIIDDDQKEKVDRSLAASIFSKFIVLAPGSVWETKKYPVDYFKSIASELVKRNYSIITIGGKEDFELGEIISRNNLQIFNFCGEFNFIQSIYLLTKAELLISNDSAPTHLGMCADIPVLTIYCSTVPDFGFYPYNDSSRFISFEELDCKPCGIHGYHKCPQAHFNCGYYLNHETVLNEALSILQQRYSQHN